jgi:hypothetical protein
VRGPVGHSHLFKESGSQGESAILVPTLSPNYAFT